MKIAVVGSGSYGTCLAILWGNAGNNVSLWCRDAKAAAEMASSRVNVAYLPRFALPAAVTVTSQLAAAVDGAEIVVMVTPSHAARAVLTQAVPALRADAILVNASKGLEEGTLATMEQVYAMTLPAPLAARATYLSGPTFANEIAGGMPAAIVLAGRDPAATAEAQRALSTDRLRIYTSEDVTGVLFGGALKNVIAIAAGVSDGMGLGSNARAALITRGLAEITRIGVASGAESSTFAGLSGMGDLVLTCSGDASRNRRVGIALGQGRSMPDILAELKMVAEGVKTTKVAYELAQKLGVSAPITEAMHALIYEGMAASEVIVSLMGRALRPERDSPQSKR